MGEQNVYEKTSDGKEILKSLPFTGVRRAISRNLVASWATSVTTSGFSKRDATRVVALKEKYAAQGNKVTYTAIFGKILSAAITINPLINCALVDKRIEVYKSINIGVAVATEEGMLLVPVIKNTEEKDVFQINQELKELSVKVREKTITEEDLTGGTVTISSMGMYDVYGFSQVLVSPQVAIYGFGNIKKEPVVLEDDTIAVHPVIYISSSTDHRILQGAPVSEFGKLFNEIFQDPEPHMGL